MRAVVQRVSEASVLVAGEVVGAIERGAVILLGVGKEDQVRDCELLARKVSRMRIFSDRDGKMNHSLLDIKGAALVVSQFTLFGDCRKGRRPSFAGAAAPGPAEAMYELFKALLRENGIHVESGRFGAMMDLRIANDGPVTLILDTEDLARSD